MMTMCQTIKQKGIVEYPWAPALGASNDGYITATLLTWSLGGDWFDSNWNPIMNESDSATIQGLQMIVDGLYNTKIINPASLTYGTQHEFIPNFTGGQSAFMTNDNIGGMPVANNPSSSQIVGDAQYMLIPGGNGTVSASWAGNESWMIPKGVSNVQNAWSYIEWYLSSPVQIALWKDIGVPSAKSSDYALEGQQGLLQQPDVLQQQASYLHNETENHQLWYSDFETAVFTEVNLVATQAKTPQQAMDDLANDLLTSIFPKYNFTPGTSSSSASYSSSSSSS
jgi:ABC-type glycerol-3-phosphate transport system substrate-binding protein